MLKGMLKGLATTLKHQVKNDTFTVQYPEQKRELPKRARWRHVLNRYEDPSDPNFGLEQCIGWSLCAAACPADAIYVLAAENTEEHRCSPGERYAEKYEINMLRCIFCGFCEEACPTDAVQLKNIYELADYDRDSFIYTKDRLLTPDPREK